MKKETIPEKMFNAILLILLTFLIMFNAASFGGVKTISFYFGHLVTMVFVFVWIIKMVFTRKIQLLQSYSVFFVLLFVLYALGYYFVSDISYYARNEVMQIIDYAFVFIVIINSFHRRKYQYFISFMLLIGALVFASIGVFQYFKEHNTVVGVGFRSELFFPDQSADQPMTLGHASEDVRTVMGLIVEEKPKQYEYRASGTWICPNHLAGFLEMIFPIGIAICLFSRMAVGVRLLVGYSLIVIITGWVLTFSRGGWLAGVAGMICLFLLAFLRDNTRGKTWVLPFVIIAIILAMSTAFIKPIKERAITITPAGDSSINTRTKIWYDTIPMIKEAPIFGYGPAAFVWRYPPFKHEKVSKVTYTHNDYLNTLVDYGFVGFIIIVAFFFCLLSKIPLIPKLYDYPDNQAILMGAIGAIIAVLAHAVFDFNNHIYSNAMLLSVVAGLVVSASTPQDFYNDMSWRFAWINRSVILLLLVGIGITLCLAGGFIHGYKLIKSDQYYREAGVLQSNILWEKALDRLQRASKLDPVNPLIYAKMADIYNAKGVFRRDSQENYNERAIELYDTAIRYNPYESDFMFKKAMLLKRLGQYRTALEALQYAIEQEPTNTAYIKQFNILNTFLEK
ncbi:MAG: O-antigen ligase family protein [Candidatus Auribacterota bacterium]|jgi:hypothetical protein|nr:O-antigen ligase family protein [Candidatus Auribacterota bacterium]